jgi:hypothetical protein
MKMRGIIGYPWYGLYMFYGKIGENKINSNTIYL